MKNKQSFQDLLTAFVGVLQSSNRIIPGVVLAILCVASWFLALIVLSPQLAIGLTVLLISFISLIVYATTKDYGQAAISLVVGLLTVFTVQWTPTLTTLFFGAWIFFTLGALILGSLNIAAQTEAIYMNAAGSLSNDPKEIQKIYGQLREVGDRSTTFGTLSPVERAEAIRLLTFRRIQIDFLRTALTVIDTLKAATRLDAKAITLFVADIFKILELTPSSQHGEIIQQTLSALRETPVPPEEFLSAFQLSRRLILAKSVPPERFLTELRRNLDIGVPADEMFEVLRSIFNEA